MSQKDERTKCLVLDGWLFYWTYKMNCITIYTGFITNPLDIMAVGGGAAAAYLVRCYPFSCANDNFTRFSLLSSSFEINNKSESTWTISNAILLNAVS